ncbi:MAG: hypothetical protein WCH11_01210, partial [Bdellovibrio sp.]
MRSNCKSEVGIVSVRNVGLELKAEPTVWRAGLNRGMAVFLVTVLLFAGFSEGVHAQENSTAMTEFRRGLASVVLVGLGGAVLGLSTLSFYSQPQEKIGHVSTGFGLGLLAGSIYVMTRSRDADFGQS